MSLSSTSSITRNWQGKRTNKTRHVIPFKEGGTNVTKHMPNSTMSSLRNNQEPTGNRLFQASESLLFKLRLLTMSELR